MENYPELPQFIRDQLTLGKRIVEFCFRSLFIFEPRQGTLEVTRIDYIEENDRRKAAFKRRLLSPSFIQLELWQHATQG